MKKYLSALLAACVMAISSLGLAADAPGVTQVILFEYDGDEAQLVERFKNRQQAYKEISPDATMRLLFDEIHGSAVGRYRIHVDYPSLEDFAKAQSAEKAARMEAPSASDRASNRVYDGLSREVIGPTNPTPRSADAKGPGVVQVVLFRYDGDEAELAANMSKSQAVYAKINPEASMRLMKDELHGGATNRYRLHIYYPSLGYFAAAQSRESNSEEWQALAAARSGDSKRSYEGLSRVVVSAAR